MDSFPSGTVQVTFQSQGVYVPTQPLYCTCPGDSSSSGTITCDNVITDIPPGKLCANPPKHSYVQIHAVWSGLSPIMSLAGMPTEVKRTLTVRVQ